MWDMEDYELNATFIMSVIKNLLSYFLYINFFQQI